MICPICKSNIRDDSVFCPVCGKPVQQEMQNNRISETVDADLSPSHENTAENTHETKEHPQGASAGEPLKPAGQGMRLEEPPSPRSVSHGEEQAAFQNGEMQYHAGHSRQGGPVPEGAGRPGQQGPGYRHQYRNVPPQGQSVRGQAPHPSGMNRPSENPLSEREMFHLKHRLSIRAMMAFVFSIFGICGITMNLPCAIIALIMSIIVRNEYRDRGWQRDTDLKLANAAFICSIIGLVIGVIGLIVLMVTGAGLIAGLSALGSLASGGSGYYGF